MAQTTSPDLFVSLDAEAPRLVSRYGTGGRGRANGLIAAERDPQSGAVSFDLEAIVKIPAEEWRRYRREYDRALQGGALIRRTAEEYAKHVEEAAKREQERSAELKAKRGAANGDAPKVQTEEAEGAGSKRKRKAGPGGHGRE